MSTNRVRTAVVTLAAGAVVCSGALAGCSISRDDEPDADKGSTSTEPTTEPSEPPSASPSTSPSESATPSASPSVTPSATPSATVARTLEEALLAAAEMPQLNEISRWAERHTGPVSQRPFGLCQKFDLLSIGALSAVERTYSSGSDTAGQQVAEFPDRQNAVRASKVIEAWHRDCASRVRGTGVRVRPFTDVAVPGGKGSWYLVSYERKGTGQFHSLGLVLSGTRMSLIRMDHEGQDHNYEPGMDPMELAVKAVSARLGGP